MTRILPIILAALAVLAGTAACEVFDDNIPTSSIYVREVTSNRMLASSTTRGTLVMHEGDTVQVKVERLYYTDEDSTENSDVTTVVKWQFNPQGVVVANSLGDLTAVDPGYTTMEVKFDPSWLEKPDHCYMDITVLP